MDPESRGANLIPGAVWRHRKKPFLTVTIRRVTEQGKVLGPSTSRSGHTPSTITLIRNYEYIGMEPGR